MEERGLMRIHKDWAITSRRHVTDKQLETQRTLKNSAGVTTEWCTEDECQQRGWGMGTVNKPASDYRKRSSPTTSNIRLQETIETKCPRFLPPNKTMGPIVRSCGTLTVRGDIKTV